MSMVNDVKPKAIKIALSDGVERELKFTLNAMAELEDRYGSVDAAFAQLDNGSFKAIRTMLWVGFLHEDANLTEQQVGNLIDMQSMENIMKTLVNAFDANMPAKTDEPAVATGTVVQYPNA